MALAVALLLDPAATAAVRAIWEEMAALGISTSMIDQGYPPHVTLLVVEEEGLAPTLDVHLPELAAHARLELKIGAAGRFDGGDVVYLGCEGEELKALQMQAAALAPPGAINVHYRPERWTPHVTLQTGGHADAALELVTELWAGMDARSVAVELLRFPPVATLKRLGV